jgi:ABC-type transport system substrate-binding protein
MIRKRFYLLGVFILVASMILSACGGGATTVAPTEEQGAAETEEAAPTEEVVETEAPTEVMTEEPTEVMTEEATEAETEAPTEEPSGATGDLMMHEAPDCEYGGLIQSIEAVDEMTVKFTFCRPDPAFPAKAAFSAFQIIPSEYLESTGGTGELVDSPIGTGPFRLDAWNRGESLVLTRFEDYWGEPSASPSVIMRWSQEGAQKLIELQAGTVDGIDNVSPDDIETVENDPNLQLVPRDPFNVFYLGMNVDQPPFDNEMVRQAVAMAIDRQRIVDNFYPVGSSVAEQFLPEGLFARPDGTTGTEFDVAAAQQLLADAGFPDGFETTLKYRDVFRGYLPEPDIVAQDIAAQLLENLNITAEIVEMESGTFIDAANAGQLEGFHLLGWTGDFPDPTNFYDYHFGSGATPQFGTPFPDITEMLTEAASLSDEEARRTIYTEVNELLKTHVPMVPIAHGASACAYKANAEGVHCSPLGNESLETMAVPDQDTFTFMQNAEPIGLYCADESDGESLRACEQIMESLLAYEVGGVEVIPSLATEWSANDDATEWTFTLREGVTFHDGSTLDANDVVLSWVVAWDAAHPLHVGRVGDFSYFSGLFGSFLNPPPAE